MSEHDETQAGPPLPDHDAGHQAWAEAAIARGMDWRHAYAMTREQLQERLGVEPLRRPAAVVVQPLTERGEVAPGAHPEVFVPSEPEPGQPQHLVTVQLEGRTVGEFPIASGAGVGEWTDWQPVQQLPLTGMTVWYRMEPRGAIAPALVLATTATVDVEDLRQRPLDSDQRVHLMVFPPLAEYGPGDAAFYRVWNVAHDEDEEAPPGTWLWPPVGVNGEQL